MVCSKNYICLRLLSICCAQISFSCGYLPLPSLWFCKIPKDECIRSKSLAVHETALCEKTVTALFLIAEFKPMQLFVLLGIKPSLFCATTSAEKLGMHMDLFYHLYCCERELLSFTVHDCWKLNQLDLGFGVGLGFLVFFFL